jgi:hypothetical protein
MHENQLIQSLNATLELQVPENTSREQLEAVLATRINDLIAHDFNHLVYLLYRIDVNEARLKLVLKENSGEDAGLIIARLMIERQAQKIKSRQENSRDNTIIDEEEKW